MFDHIRIANADALTLEEVIDHVIEIHQTFHSHWSDGGWAPGDAAQLLQSSRIDWLVSLAHTLKVWTDETPTTQNEDGLLILAWANLGSLVEGSMKFFLSVYFCDYQGSVRRKKSKSIFKKLWMENKQTARDVDGLMLDLLRQFFEIEVWNGLDRREWCEWLLHVQERRNTIHAYRSRELGTFDEFFNDIRLYRLFLLEQIAGLPDPPDVPR